MQVPAHDQRARHLAVQRLERRLLALDLGHAAVQADAVADLGCGQHLHQPRGQQLRIAQLKGIERPVPADLPRQRGKEHRQPLDQRWRPPRPATARQRRDLEHQRAGLCARDLRGKAATNSRVAMAASRKCGLGTFPRPSSSRITRIADQRRRLHHEAEIIRHLVGVAPIFDGGDRRVEGPVEADRSQQRDLRIGRQTLAAQRHLRMHARRRRARASRERTTTTCRA